MFYTPGTNYPGVWVCALLSLTQEFKALPGTIKHTMSSSRSHKTICFCLAWMNGCRQTAARIEKTDNRRLERHSLCLGECRISARTKRMRRRELMLADGNRDNESCSRRRWHTVARLTTLVTKSMLAVLGCDCQVTPRQAMFALSINLILFSFSLSTM